MKSQIIHASYDHTIMPKSLEPDVSSFASFPIALANLANAVKDQGRIADAIIYYRRAVQANPDFAEAVCGLATALNSVCNWYGRGGVYADHGRRDRIHVDDYGMMHEARKGSGWVNRVVEIVDRQLKDGETHGMFYV
jgi:tetratricopeptide (TPR) repeat protein